MYMGESNLANQNLFKSKAVFILLIICSFFISTPLALVSGIIFSFTGLFYKPKNLSMIRKRTLETAVVLLGFGLNIKEVYEVGSKGIFQTALALTILLVCGFLLGKGLNLHRNISTLISCGTAICGGSAIAAVAPVIDADDNEIAVSTGVVFLLNAIALFLFPILGHSLNMTSKSFGLWSALSIHDTSSVVGAASSFSPEALKIATLVKLTRTLWIIPLSLFLGILYGTKKNIKFPIFIIFFLVAVAIASILPTTFYKELFYFGKRLMAPALFMVGYAIKPDFLKRVGAKGIAFGSILWMVSIFLGYVIATNIIL